MSILAEPRRKNRISIDPQNLQWKNDDQKTSRKMMEKMGWSDGDGLGRNRQGDSDHIKLKANYSGKGLGADKVASYDSTWIGHHDDFADLLSALNKNKQETPKTEEETAERNKKLSLELNSKSLRRRIHYQKFTRAKDTSNYSANDKSSVMGVGLKRTKEEEPEKVEEKPKSDSENDVKGEISTGNTTVSTMSVAEYFAAKMAALTNKKQQVKEEPTEEREETVKREVKEECAGSEDEMAERKRLKKERKEARRLARQQEVKEEVTVKEEPLDEEEQELSEKSQRKKDKKRKRELERMMAEQGETGEVAEGEPEVKRMKKEIKEEVDDETSATDDVPEKKKKKKSKKVDVDE